VRLGDVSCGLETGHAFILSTAVDHPSGCSLPTRSAQSAVLSPNAPITLHGHGRVGTAYGLAYARVDGRLLCYFHVDPSEAHRLRESESLFATPIIDAGRIACLTCGRSFRRGDRACNCLKVTPRVVLHEVSINSVALCERTQHHLATETRDQIVLATTASVLANLVFK
jgi:hypothetical protein